MIELKNLCAGYEGREILHRINLTFEPGRVYGIVGPNGCGKSTLLKTMVGLRPALSGEVLLNGASLCRLAPNQVARMVTYLPQSRNIPAITAQRLVLHGRFPYLSYPRRYRREDYEATQQALEWVQATKLADIDIQKLSGGQRQRVYLAMAIAQDTRTILMDEPTTYLDIGSRFEVMDLAQKLTQMGKAVVMVLHDLELVLRYAAHVIVMGDGCVIAEGAPDDVYSQLGECFGVKALRMESADGAFYSFLPTENKLFV